MALQLFLSSLTSTVLTQVDRYDLFSLVYNDGTEHEVLFAAVSYSEFNHKEFSDTAAKYLSGFSENAKTLLRQLDDPLVGDDAVARSLLALCRENMPRKQLYLMLTLASHLRNAAIDIATSMQR